MKFVVLGRYTQQGLGGFVKNPSDNRAEAAKKNNWSCWCKVNWNDDS